MGDDDTRCRYAVAMSDSRSMCGADICVASRDGKEEKRHCAEGNAERKEITAERMYHGDDGARKVQAVASTMRETLLRIERACESERERTGWRRR